MISPVTKVASTISSENNGQNRAQNRLFGRSDDMDDFIRHAGTDSKFEFCFISCRFFSSFLRTH